ncbi:hypothetical protein X801_03453 [Opisthorchis viverrini]|uniref:Uncharacterized protein n=2 Tax=Opisthorchis viverrini TaxID=6198 RepID=A0A1S8X2D9_OPIVI|nr:hypothetical protein T265_04743 [Opisthorchis viverrini]KER28435.1 hypothetical protein T265_04743 [Opisthorchis viverrini]OON20663.1 hypothetical protein X801_03453 [Opisthorchis viverrini]
MCTLHDTDSQVNFLVGKNALDIGSIDLGTGKAWTSIHNFAPNNTFRSSGWYDADPRTNEPLSVEMLKWERRPKTTATPVALALMFAVRLQGSGTVREQSVSVVCEGFSTRDTNVLQVKFKDCWDKEPEMTYATDSIPAACYDETKTTTTTVQCVKRCAHDVHCRSVYYSQKGGRCVAVLYVHAYLPLRHRRNAKRWTCFRKSAGTL